MDEGVTTMGNWGSVLLGTLEKLQGTHLRIVPREWGGWGIYPGTTLWLRAVPRSANSPAFPSALSEGACSPAAGEKPWQAEKQTDVGS